MKSLRYAGGCLIRCPLLRGGLILVVDVGGGEGSVEEGGVVSVGGGMVVWVGVAPANGLLLSAGGVSGLLSTIASPSLLLSPDGAPPEGGVLHFRKYL